MFERFILECANVHHYCCNNESVNAQEESEGRSQEVRGDRAEPASVEAHEAGRREGQQDETRKVNPTAEVEIL